MAETSHEITYANAEAATEEELRRMECPRCGAPMQPGFVAGHWFKLRWVETNRTVTMFAGEKLRKKFDHLWSAPTVGAVRCDRCKIGLFRYDY